MKKKIHIILLTFALAVPYATAISQPQAERIHQTFEAEFPNWFFKGDDYTRYIFLNMSEFWRQSTFTRQGDTKPLPVDLQDEVADLKVSVSEDTSTLINYVRNSPTDGVIVVKDGRIVFEDYPRMAKDDLHIWFSVSKTFVSTAVAILEDRGKIESNRGIDFYLQELKGTAWEGIPVRDILDMASGIDCQEVHSDLDSCFWSFYNAIGWPLTDRTLRNPIDTLTVMKRLRPSGEVMDYTSVNTETLKWLVERVSGERYADFIEREIWHRIGAESPAFIVSTSSGEAFSAGGVSSTLRDLARYGMLFTSQGQQGDSPVVSDAYMEKIQKLGRPELTGGPLTKSGIPMRHNSYQWDLVTQDGDLYKGGAGGQGLYVSPSENVVIAWFGTHTSGGEGTAMRDIAYQIVKSNVLNK